MTDPAARPHGTDAQAARSEAGGQRPAPGGLWLLLAPLACCGLPLLAAGLAAAGTLAWGGLGLALAAAAAGAALYARHHRRACPRPQRPGQRAGGRDDHSRGGRRDDRLGYRAAAGRHHESGPDALVAARSRVPEQATAPRVLAAGKDAGIYRPAARRGGAGPGLGDRHADRDRAR